jgi:hypothetical protein
MADVHATLWTRRDYACAIGARHVELLLDYTGCFVEEDGACPFLPTPYCLAQLRICMLQSPVVEECLVLHVTVSNVARIFFLQCSTTFSVEFRFPCDRFLQKKILVHATVSHTLFISLQCISRMCESLFALYLCQRNWKLLLRERNKKLILSREREFLILM